MFAPSKNKYNIYHFVITGGIKTINCAIIINNNNNE